MCFKSSFHFEPVVVDPAKKQHLGVFRGFVESARNRNGLSRSRVAAQFIFSGLPHLPAGNEVGLVEILQFYRHDRIVQDLCVGRLDRLDGFLCCQTLQMDVARAYKAYEAIRLHGRGLIEFRSQRKRQRDDIACAQLVSPVAMLKLGMSRIADVFSFLHRCGNRRTCRCGCFVSLGCSGGRTERQKNRS